MTGREPAEGRFAEPFQEASPPDEDQGRPAREENMEDYMSNLGAGTGVDIGPGAAGEMGGAARDPGQAAPRKEASQESGEYPDSGDLPQINR